jgi:hypothetical protein
MSLQKTPRRGFAMMLVLVFIVLFMAMLGVACRQTASALRIETVRASQIERDEGSMHAVARGLALLESGLPPADPYECAVEINTSIGLRSFTVTFASDGAGNWSVNSKVTEEGSYPIAMPTMFTPPST